MKASGDHKAEKSELTPATGPLVQGEKGYDELSQWRVNAMSKKRIRSREQQAREVALYEHVGRLKMALEWLDKIC